MTFLPTQDRREREKACRHSESGPPLLLHKVRRTAAAKAESNLVAHTPPTAFDIHKERNLFSRNLYIRSERSETDSGEIRLSTDRRYGIELFGSVSPQGEFLTQTTKIPVSTKFSTRVSTEITSAGPPKLYPSAMKITPAPTSPRVNIPIERARRSLNFRSR